MEREQIIPTQYKSKIPHTLSYPVGAKAISEALRGVPQFSELTVHFSFLDTSPRNGPAILRNSGSVFGPLRFLSASRTVDEQSHDRQRWSIAVHAVPRSLRHVIQAKILAEALPSIRRWLLANPHSTEREGGHGLTFNFDELKNELICEENASVEWQTTRVD